jgi:thioredoxin reductase
MTAQASPPTQPTQPTQPLPQRVDVLIVGAGPAGLAAAAELGRAGIGKVLVLEREDEAGGVPRHCAHSPYGMREFSRLLPGAAYARRLRAEAIAAGAEIRTRISATALHPAPGAGAAPDSRGVADGPLVEVTDAAFGPARIAARAVLLAMGARETSRPARLLGGTRPGGVLNTGALQGIVHLNGQRPFLRPVVVGTELVAFSALLTCMQAGIRPVAMLETSDRTTARWPAPVLARLLGVPLLFQAEIEAIEGDTQVTGVRVRMGQTRRRLAADGVILTGGFRPEASLLANSALAVDPATGGPEVDEHGRCTLPGYFAAGNLLRAVETAGRCHAEGRAVAHSILRDLRGQLPPQPAGRLTVGPGLAYVMPQRIAGGRDPAFGVLQLRLTAPARGRLALAEGPRRLAARPIDSLPERRIVLPLPPPGSAARVSLEPAPGNG